MSYKPGAGKCQVLSRYLIELHARYPMPGDAWIVDRKEPSMIILGTFEPTQKRPVKLILWVEGLETAIRTGRRPPITVSAETEFLRLIQELQHNIEVRPFEHYDWINSSYSVQEQNEVVVRWEFSNEYYTLWDRVKNFYFNLIETIKWIR